MLIILIIIANNSQLISDSLVFTYRINQVTQLRKLKNASFMRVTDL